MTLAAAELEVASKGGDSPVAKLLELQLKYSLPNEKRKNRKRVKETNRKQNLLFHANFLQGEISQGVHFQTESDENENIPKQEPSFDEDIFSVEDLDYSNWKKGCQFLRSVSKTAKPKIKPHRRVKTAEKNKSLKTAQNVADNTCARKTNIQEKLDKENVRRFGNEIYDKRSTRETNTAKSNKHTRTITSKRRRQPKEPMNEVDHPNALKYELKTDNAAKGTNSHMNKIVDLQHRDITPEDFELLLILDESVAPKTVSVNFLTSLTVVVVDKAEILGELCSICMEVYQASEKAKKLPCNHLFHENCIDNWLSYASPNCPLDGIPVEA